jgi:hypothetical protein
MSGEFEEIGGSSPEFGVVGDIFRATDHWTLQRQFQLPSTDFRVLPCGGWAGDDEARGKVVARECGRRGQSEEPSPEAAVGAAA